MVWVWKRRGNVMNIRQCIKRLVGSFLLIFLLVAPFLSQVNHYLSIPNEIVSFNNDSIMDHKHISALNDGNSIFTFDLPFYSEETVEDTSEVLVKAANVPVKKIDVSYLDNKEVIVGGKSVGVQLHTLLLLV